MKKMLVIACASLAVLCAGCAAQEPPKETSVKSSADFSAKTDVEIVETTAPPVAELPKAKPVNAEKGVYEIKERFFIAQTMDVYYNPDDYMGRTVSYEGVFDAYEDDSGEQRYEVIRKSPGCCGADGVVGFEVLWDGECPEGGAWCKATGVVGEYEFEGNTYLCINLTSLDTLETRGEEFVTQ